MRAVTFILVFLAVGVSADENTYTLTVKVNDLRNGKGIVQFSLYNKEGSIPDEHFEHYLMQEKSAIKNNSALVVFNNLPKGNYAVNILHDENQDGKIDKGFVLPKEGIGFSNFKSIGFRNKPSFKKAQFLLNSNQQMNVKVIYF